MSPKYNWVDKNDGVISPAPMTAMTMATLMRDSLPAGTDRDRIKVKNETTIEVDGDWGRVVLRGVKP